MRGRLLVWCWLNDCNWRRRGRHVFCRILLSGGVDVGTGGTQWRPVYRRVLLRRGGHFGDADCVRRWALLPFRVRDIYELRGWYVWHPNDADVERLHRHVYCGLLLRRRLRVPERRHQRGHVHDGHRDVPGRVLVWRGLNDCHRWWSGRHLQRGVLLPRGLHNSDRQRAVQRRVRLSRGRDDGNRRRNRRNLYSRVWLPRRRDYCHWRHHRRPVPGRVLLPGRRDDSDGRRHGRRVQWGLLLQRGSHHCDTECVWQWALLHLPGGGICNLSCWHVWGHHDFVDGRLHRQL